MAYGIFENEDLLMVSEALDIAEDQAGDFYKFSLNQWKRHHYDVKTLSTLNQDEISPYAFALLNKGARVIRRFEPTTKRRDFYFICLQDHRILRALQRDKNLRLLPLLVYIFTHELVHIVRFCNFSQRFEISGEGRQEEERLVHKTTCEILESLSLPRIDYVLESYRGHRVCDLSMS
jgi:hypothetical protein